MRWGFFVESFRDVPNRVTMSTIRREFTFFGRVQGVGFRFTACQLAAGYPITGWIKNLNDGSVQIVVEGAAGEIDKFVSELEENINGRGHGRIDSCSQSGDLPAGGNFDSFGIR